MPSWIAFLLAYQIAHKVTTVLINSVCGIVSISEKIHLLVFPSVVACRRDDISSFVRAHMQRAIVQSRREWRHESCAPHIWHRSSVAIFLCSLTSSVGIECFASLHRKFLIFPGTFTDHKDFQDPSGSRTMHVVRLNKPSAAPVPPLPS